MTYIPESLLPAGMMLPYCGINLPKNWLWCYGQAIDRVEYGILFSAIGTTYGNGDGINTFNIPDFRGRVVIGAGAGTGLTNRVIGQKGGKEDHTLTVQELPSHHHTVLNQDLDTAGQRGFDKAMPPAGNTSDTGGDQPHNNMQPFVVISGMIIRYQ